MTVPDRDRHVAELRENGITIVENYLDEETAESFYERITGSLDSDEFARGDEYATYGEMANADEPVADRRTGTDEGMIDIFNMDTVVPDIEKIKSDPDINGIINMAAGREFTPTNINTYVRRSVTNPTWYHADSYSKFKTFVYLTDVPDRTYGPYSYVEGSHNVSTVEKFGTVFLNRIKGQSGASHAIVPNPEEALHATAPKGTLIISNQAGYHRAHPQEEGRERVLLTTSYSPERQRRDPVLLLANKTAKVFG